MPAARMEFKLKNWWQQEATRWNISHTQIYRNTSAAALDLDSIRSCTRIWLVSIFGVSYTYLGIAYVYTAFRYSHSNRVDLRVASSVDEWMLRQRFTPIRDRVKGFIDYKNLCLTFTASFCSVWTESEWYGFSGEKYFMKIPLIIFMPIFYRNSYFCVANDDDN